MTSRPSRPEDLIPLRPVYLSVLLVLRSGPQHGFAVMDRANEHLGRHAVLGPGTLYRTLKEMRETGLVSHADAPDATDGRRQYYQLTDLGLGVVEAEARRLAGLLQDADLFSPAVDSR